MAEFGDFEFGGGERGARPAEVPPATSAAAATPATVAGAAPRGRLSSLAAPAVILVAAAAILSWRPPEPRGSPSR